jgi:hypothetical protein
MRPSILPFEKKLSYQINSASWKNNGAHDRDWTGEPLPYQGSALPTELRGQSLLTLVCSLRAAGRVVSITAANLRSGAGDEIRTRDIQLGRLKLYQLSYSRINHLYSQQTKIDYVVTIHSKLRSPTQYFWWWGEDLNLRRLSRQIYSLIPLTTREPHQSISISGADTPNRTEDILITSEMLYQLSYIGLS